MAKILVTGVNGFVGKHLARELAVTGHEVTGASRDQMADPSIEKYLSDYHACDLTNSGEVSDLPLDSLDSVINLAGLAAVGKSFDEPERYLQINVSVFSILADRIRELGNKSLRIVAISTGAVYDPNQPLPLTESSKTAPGTSPYAASKIAMEDAAKGFRSEGYSCVIARPFNHIGPGQEQGFLLPDLYSKISSQSGSEIKVGNLETMRDYTDVRDVARAYVSLATTNKLQYDIYNVCSGRAISGNEILDKLKKVMGKPDLKTVVDQSLFRPSDQPILFGDNSRLKSETKWQPTIPLEKTLKDFVQR